jgi:hypothetical protein
MTIPDWMERLGRTIFEAPFGSATIMTDTPELAEVRLAVLDEVKAQSHRVAGRSVFPHNVVRIRLRGVPVDQADRFQGRFFSQFCEEELRKGLTRSNYRFPSDLRVEVETTPALPGAGDKWLVVEAETHPAPQGPTHPKKPARLILVKGAANTQEIVLSKARTYIGRSVDVYRADGPSRRNDLAFSETDPVSRTVSREHAHIDYLRKTGEYRLFNDRSYQTGPKRGANCGLWILRDGLSLEVHRGPRGTRLEPGDEIHLGRAVVKFTQR